MSSCGPVFFTGGTALREVAFLLARQNAESTHIVATFDSGGSSKTLREAFAIPAVGDIRNRLLALARPENENSPLLSFLQSRLPADISSSCALNILKDMGKLSNPCWAPLPHRQKLFEIFKYFLINMPDNFDARGASIGNIILTSLYLENNRDFGPAIAFLSNLLHISGTVIPVTDANLSLAAILADGSMVFGQHLFKKISIPVSRVFLTVHSRHPSMEECRPPINKDAIKYIKQARIICYPMGSFYSSVVANLMPRGVGSAIASAKAVKVFIPNTGRDAEATGLGVPDQVAIILSHLRRDAPEAPVSSLLNYVLVDLKNGEYGTGWNPCWNIALEKMGVRVICRDIVKAKKNCQHEPGLTLKALYELEAEK